MSTPASRWINSRITDALGRAFDQIDSYQRDGYCTEEDVTEAIERGWGDVVADGWRAYINEEN